MNMDYHEFKEKSGWKDTTVDDYEQYVLPAYLKGPSDVIGIEVTLFCRWLNDNGITMKQLKAIMPIISDYDEGIAKIQTLQQKVRDLEAEVTVLGLHEQKLQERLDAVIEVVGDESLVERMTDDIGTEDIIDAWIRSKNMKQNGRQVGQ